MPPKLARSKSTSQDKKKKAGKAKSSPEGGDLSPKHKKKEEPYFGPRPDQELFRFVSEDAVAGRPSCIEDVYTLLWKGGEDVNQRSYDGLTPLSVAATAGDANLVAMLLEKDADVTKTNVNTKETPFHYAVKFGHKMVVQLLLTPAFAAGIVDSPNVAGFPPLQVAAEKGHIDILKMLLRSSADPSARNMMRGGTTALHAASLARDFELCETLLDYDAEVDVPNQLGRTALFNAVQNCDPRTVAFLLRSRADAHRRDLDGLAPMDLLPKEHEHFDKVFKTLTNYTKEPFRLRGDAHFELKSGHPAELI